MKKLFAIAGLAALTACGATDPTDTSFFREAGAGIDQGSFGNATMNNTMIMSGEIDYAVALARRFDDSVQTTINFEFDSAQLDANAMAILRQQADWIKQFPEVRFTVYGHTDLVGTTAYNNGLGLRRAQAAVNFLVAQGISRSRLDAVVSLGETQPLIMTNEREVQNRRTVTQVSGWVETHPLVLNGKYAEVVFREYVQSAEPATAIQRTTTGELGQE